MFGSKNTFIAFLEATQTTTVKNKIQLEHGQRDEERFYWKGQQMRNNHIKRCSLSLAIA